MLHAACPASPAGPQTAARHARAAACCGSARCCIPWPRGSAGQLQRDLGKSGMRGADMPAAHSAHILRAAAAAAAAVAAAAASLAAAASPAAAALNAAWAAALAVVAAALIAASGPARITVCACRCLPWRTHRCCCCSFRGCCSFASLLARSCAAFACRPASQSALCCRSTVLTWRGGGAG